MKILPFLFLVFLSACTSSSKKGRKVEVREHESPLDLPPRAPIPPQFYCYQFSQGEKAISLQLTITGDSIYGKTDYKVNRTTTIPGTITGIVYGNMLMVSYKEERGPSEEQEWKMDMDSIYRQPLDSIVAEDTTHIKIKYPDRALFLSAMYRVPCTK